MKTTLLIFIGLTISNAFGQNCSWKAGWEPWAPYSFRNKKMDNKLEGLDIGLMRAVAKAAGCTITFHERPWKRQLQDVESGKLDVAMAASITPERSKYGNFSDVYRHETVKLFIRKSDKGKFAIKSLDDIVKTNFRLGVTRGYYNGKTYEEKIKSDKNFKARVQEVATDQLNYDKLLNNRIDGFVAEIGAGVQAIQEKGLKDKITQHGFTFFEEAVYVIMSKKTMDKANINLLNKGLKKIKESKEFDKIYQKYLGN